jgi:5-formyltetrahydrofolate cyclo-ligase
MISSRRKTLRKELRSARRALTPAQQHRASRQLFQRLAQHPLFIRSHHIAFYLANDGEIDPGLLFNYAQRLGKICYLPVLSEWPTTRMAFQRIRPGQRWSRNRFGITEPKTDRKAQTRPWRLNLVLMPLVGFDEHGNRLGMGGGFYDRMFAYRRMRSSWGGPQLLGLAHSCQKVEVLPVKSWDIPLNGIVTDAECILFSTS